MFAYIEKILQPHNLIIILFISNLYSLNCRLQYKYVKILLYTDNLLTCAQLEGTWRNAGAEICTREEATPDLIVVDLTNNKAEAQIKALRKDFPDTEILAFGPHVDGDAFKRARVAGASSQVARGKVVERVLKLLP